MKKVATLLILMVSSILLILSCGSPKSSFKREQLMGDWKTIKGDNEYISFEKEDSDYVYSAYTYDRLTMSGTWELIGDKVSINYDDGTTASFSLKFKGDSMLFNNGEEIYVRLVLSADAKTPVADISDTQILEQIIKNFDVVFSEAEPFNEDWVDKSVKWQKIRTDFTLKNKDLNKFNELSHNISEFLIERGFIVDTTRISEKVVTYLKGKLCVMIRTNASENPTAGEVVSIDVISGLEEK